jgi:hypothetical protein
VNAAADFVNNRMISSEQMILIGSTGRNSGKTTLAAELIRRWKDRFPIVALKVTTIACKGVCQRGGEGCGSCTDISSDFLLEEEQDGVSGKDTVQLLKAGAAQVFWLRTLHSAIAEGFACFIEKTLPDALLICESNSLRELVNPGCFIMLANGENGEIKPSAVKVADYADITGVNVFEPENLDRLMAMIRVERNMQGRIRAMLWKE